MCGIVVDEKQSTPYPNRGGDRIEARMEPAPGSEQRDDDIDRQRSLVFGHVTLGPSGPPSLSQGRPARWRPGADLGASGVRQTTRPPNA